MVEKNQKTKTAELYIWCRDGSASGARPALARSLFVEALLAALQGASLLGGAGAKTRFICSTGIVQEWRQQPVC